MATLVLAICGLLGFYRYLGYRSERELREALAEADELDPNWRLTDMRAQRPALADNQNAVMQIRAVKKGLGGNWTQAIDETFQENLEPPVLLSPQQHQVLREELGKVAPALATARQLAEMPEGCFDAASGPDWISALLPDVFQTRDVVRLLDFDMMLLLQDGDIDAALRSCRAILNGSRAGAEESFLIGLLVRCACQSVAIGRLERALAHGQASPQALLDLQQHLEREEAEPSFLQAVRGERAYQDALLEAAIAGEPEAVKAVSDAITGSPTADRMLGTLIGGSLRANRAALLRYSTRVVQIAKLPFQERHAELAKLEATIHRLPAHVRQSGPVYGKCAEADRRTHAQLRCAIVLTATERFRREQGRWPENLDVLVPKYLQTMPKDPIDGAPLRYRRLRDGVVIYSIGQDGIDDGGTLDRANPMEPGTDWGYQLWDPAHRRQAPVRLPEEK